MVDWSILGTSKKGLAVEGKSDKLAIEAFLDAGEAEGHWSNWRGQLIVEQTNGKVTGELDSSNSQVWGLIDRDRRTDDEVSDLQARYHQLLVLPRFTIENYCIDPIEILEMLPATQRARVPNLKDDIENHLEDWVKNGALWKVLSEQGAHDFCRGRERGYPMALLYIPVTVEADIEAQLSDWHQQLEPKQILGAYNNRVKDYLANTSDHYTLHIHRKNFFHQVVVQHALNPGIRSRSQDDWFADLFSSVTTCPADIVPVLKRVVS